MPMFDKAIVLGAGGMLGRCVTAELTRRGAAHRAYRHADLDLGDFDAIRQRLSEAQPAIIFNCAAFTRVDDCETQRDDAMRINGEAVGVLAETARRLDALLVHISSDYVFGGDGTRPYREDDAPAPDHALSAYGLSKLEGDRRIVASGCRHLIARTSWVYGTGGPNFVDAIIRAAHSRPELSVVNDQRGRPTYAADLCEGIFRLLDRGAEGLVNVTNSDECTWYEFACEIVRRAGLHTPVRPCTTAEFPRPARRPAYSVLDIARFVALVGAPLRSWREALGAYLEARGVE
ncbi:MAG: dTDP-4-dehydrorhamnose reductase [Phycisphaerae bacterium]|nr:dTDP-4-dehydrorhamnose reductase [Phycisphaerae bacterium]